MSSRWMNVYDQNAATRSLARSAITTRHSETLFPLEHPQWTTVTSISAAQAASHEKPPEDAQKKNDVSYISSCVWASTDVKELKARVLVLAHGGQASHHGVKATWHTLRENCTGTGMCDDFRALFSGGLVFLLGKAGERFPRALGQALRTTKLNEILYFDFVIFGNDGANKRYLLVCKEELSDYVWLTATSDTPPFDGSDCSSLGTNFCTLGALPLKLCPQDRTTVLPMVSSASI